MIDLESTCKHLNSQFVGYASLIGNYVCKDCGFKLDPIYYQYLTREQRGLSLEECHVIFRKFRHELYFCVHLTENEHSVFVSDIQKWCESNSENLYLLYYRKLKDGHVPMHRECKIIGTDYGIAWIRYTMLSLKYNDYCVKNPYRSHEVVLVPQHIS